MTVDTRWTTALHESGHAVAAIALGGRCCGLVLFDDASGQAHLSELLSDREAFSIAAGQAAEQLAEIHAAPECSLTVAVETLPQTSEFLCTQLAKGEDVHNEFVSDSRLLALWAIQGLEDQPESWAGRVAHAHRIAAEIVERNAAAIVRVAESLFVCGSLGEQEIRMLFEGNE